MFFKRRDALLILGVLILAGAVFFITRMGSLGKAPSGTVRIYVDGKLYAEETLGQARDIVITQENGEENTLRLTENGFSMAHSTCKNQLCVQQGEVTTENYPRRSLGAHVICLPNRVDAELTLAGQTPPPDLPDI